MPKKEDIELGERLGEMKAQLAALQAKQAEADDYDDDEDEDDEEPFEEKAMKFLERIAQIPLVRQLATEIGTELKARGGVGAVLDRVLPKRPAE